MTCTCWLAVPTEIMEALGNGNCIKASVFRPDPECPTHGCTCFSVDPITFEVSTGVYNPDSWFRPDPGCPIHGCPMTPDKEA